MWDGYGMSLGWVWDGFGLEDTVRYDGVWCSGVGADRGLGYDGIYGI